MHVAVAGGSGLVGRLAVAGLRAAGHEPVVIARSYGVDLTTGAGLAERLAGCDAVIDVTNIVTTRRKAAVGFFSRATGNLLAASRQAGVGHVVALSIVGVDRVGLGYYIGKRRQEELVRTGGVPWTVLRATQFFEFPEPLLAGRSPVAAMPVMLSQPVAAAEVAAALVAYAGRPAAGMAAELAGPEQLRMVDMARRVVRARGGHKVVLPVPIPGAVGKAMAGGDLLPQGEHTRGARTFDQHLAAVRAARSTPDHVTA